MVYRQSQQIVVLLTPCNLPNTVHYFLYWWSSWLHRISIWFGNTSLHISCEIHLDLTLLNFELTLVYSMVIESQWWPWAMLDPKVGFCQAHGLGGDERLLCVPPFADTVRCVSCCSWQGLLAVLSCRMIASSSVSQRAHSSFQLKNVPLLAKPIHSD